MKISNKELNAKLSKIILNAWADDSFKLRLIEEPDKVCEEYDLRTEDNSKIVFHLDSGNVKNFVIPMNPSDYVGEKVKLDVEKMAYHHVSVTCTRSWSRENHGIDNFEL